MTRIVLPAFVAIAVLVAGPASAQGPAADCTQWEECRERALDARANRQYERFHDLAWRAIQTAEPNDPALMYLLARAQALSGRRRDALVMLRRLADMGVATEAAAEEDLQRVRELPGWTEIAARFERLRATAAEPTSVSTPAASTAGAAVPPRATERPPEGQAPAADIPAVTPADTRARRTTAPPVPAAAPPAAVAVAPAAAPPVRPSTSSPVLPAAPPVASPTAGTAAAAPTVAAAAAAAVPPPPLSIEPLPATDVARFSTAAFSPAGIAYDEVSRRFLFGDTLGRRLFVVGEGSSRTVDLIRGDSAGFHDVTALEIGRRGDLWVTSTAANGGAAAIHRLQLISGRALDTFAAPADAPVTLADLSVAANGTVLALDRRAPRLLRLRPGAQAIETAMAIETADPVSLTVADTERTVFVAHAGGLTHVDLQRETMSAVSAPAGLSLERLERIRWHRNSIVGVQRLADGSRALIVLRLDRAGTRVTGARIVAADLRREGRTPLLTIVGDDVYYSVIDTPSATATVDVLVRRIRLP